jgi:hypothetical protein
MTFFYSNQSSLQAYLDAVAAQDEEWVTAQQISRLLRALRNCNFAARDSRNSALEALRSIVPTHPYRINGDGNPATGDLRFGFLTNSASPINSLITALMFVNLDRRGWRNTIEQCRSALEFNDRNNEKTMLTNGSGETETDSNNTPNPQINRSQFNDASQAFRRSVQAMCDMIRNGVSVYNLEIFENEFQLQWSILSQSPVDELRVDRLPQKAL